MKHSIIIPTAGRPEAIKGAIQSLLALSPGDHDAEILVIDNNTQMDLVAELQGYCESLKSKVRYVREPSPGLGAARHCGMREAQGEILTFIDDDVEVRTGWLLAIQTAFDDPEVALVGGPSIPKFTGTIPAWFWPFIKATPYGGWCCSWLSLLDIGHGVKDIDPNYIWGLNFSIRKKVAIECGGFHPDLVPKSLQRWQGDGETGLTMKIRASGYRADYVPEAGLFHLCGNDRLNKDYFCKRAYYEGVSNSFSSIRAGLKASADSSPYPNLSFYQGLRRRISLIMAELLGRFSPLKKQYNEIREQTDRAYVEGWRFHQNEVANDPRLLEWVRRTDYWNADIREQKN